MTIFKHLIEEAVGELLFTNIPINMKGYKRLLELLLEFVWFGDYLGWDDLVLLFRHGAIA